jgi:pimeloyl-ACP methyl ester carboxylesterase
VIVLPGIMGSELVDAKTRKVLWGLADPRWYASAWTSGAALRALAVTDDERAGRTGRIEATRLLATPAGVPVLHGIEPYRRLVARVREVAVHRDAVLEFPYDWRLSVEYNARVLATTAREHLKGWLGHRYWRETGRDNSGARLTLVAHSMGGLVARHYVNLLGGADIVRRTVTLGTPFYGATKAAYILNTGRGAPLPLPRRRLRELAATMPGLYDLLPAYRCVDEGTSFRRLTAADVEAIGGSAELAAEAAARGERTRSGPAVAARAFVGVDQPTMQNIAIRNGVVVPLIHTCLDVPDGGVRRENRTGDSTVYRESAALGAQPGYVAQNHAALARADEALDFVRAVLTEIELGPPLGGDLVVGLDVPDVVDAGQPFTAEIVTLDNPAAVDARLVDTATNAPERPPVFLRADGMLRATLRLDRPGLYRLEVSAGSGSAVTQLVMVVPPTDAGTDAEWTD